MKLKENTDKNVNSKVLKTIHEDRIWSTKKLSSTATCFNNGLSAKPVKRINWFVEVIESPGKTTTHKEITTNEKYDFISSQDKLKIEPGSMKNIDAGISLWAEDFSQEDLRDLVKSSFLQNEDTQRSQEVDQYQLPVFGQSTSSDVDLIGR